MSIGSSAWAVVTIACVLACVASRGAAQAPGPYAPNQPAPTTPPPAAPGAQPAPALPSPGSPAGAAPAPGTSTPTPPTAAAPSASAPPIAAEPAPEAVERAREAYAQGQRAFAQGEFAVAQAAFEEAFANVPNPIVLVSIAESAAKQGRVDVALAAYDKYLRLRPDAPDRADVEEKRSALAQTPGEITLTSEPPGADVTVDGQPTGKRTPALLQLSPGEHRIELALAGHAADPQALDVAPGARTEHAVMLRAEAPSEPAAATPSAPAAATSAPPMAAIAITAGLGAAGLIAGTALGIAALSERSDYNKQPTSSSADRGERLALFSDVGFGIGGMALITAAVLLFTHDAGSADQHAAHLQIVPSVTPHAASATAQLRF
jgi:hypothetical protein